MGNLIKNTGKDYSSSDKYYSKALKLAFDGKRIDAGRSAIGVDIYQLYAVGSIITNDSKYDLSGNVADIVFLFLNGKQNEHLFDIVDTSNRRRLIYVGTDNVATKFLMYYCNNGTVYKLEFTSGVSLGSGLIHLSLNLTNGTVVGGKGQVFTGSDKYEYNVTVTNVTNDEHTPSSYKNFDDIEYGIRIQGDADGNVIANTDERFRAARISIDDRDVCCVQCVKPNIYDWVTQSYFNITGNAVPSLLGNAARELHYSIFKLSNNYF